MPLLLLLSACGSPDPVGGDSAAVEAAAEVARVTVSPDEVTLATGPTGGVPTTFVATATFTDGSELVLEEADWSISNSVTGSVDASGVFTPAPGAGGVTYVTARFAGVEDSALATVVYTDEIVDEGTDPTVFSGAEVSHPGMWTYPQNGVSFPRNTPGITFQWAELGQSGARLRFRSGVTEVTVYTTGTGWTADEALWQLIAATNAGGTVTVELALAVGPEVWVDDPITLNVNRMDGAGTVYYWSTSAEGTLRIPYAGVAETFVVDPGGNCIGCHAIGGGKIAYTLRVDGQGSWSPQVGVQSIADGSTLLAASDALQGSFKAWSPDGNWLVVTHQGGLHLYDGNTFQYIAEIAVEGFATQPDWSPDGTQLAFVIAQDYHGDSSFSNGAIAVMDWIGKGQFGPATVLWDAPDPYNAYYPAWSPDSRWIAFDQSTEDSYDDADATLWVIPREGGTPVELAAANLATGMTNSYPRWGPLPDDDVLWIAFSSVRNYGNVTSGMHQIWVAGFDPALAEAGADPSWPAFWLPGQDPTQSNHVPIWYDQ